MREGVKKFVFNTLLVDPADFEMDSVVSVRRVKSFGAAKIDNECLVVFSDIERRDFVYSHARNLATQPILDGKRISNLRMQIPAHLLECFRTLDTHGHLLKLKYEKKGIKIRRHVNFDDEAESLYLDVKITKEDPWERIYPDYARSERRKRERRVASQRRDRLSSIIESGSDLESEEEREEERCGNTSRRAGKGFEHGKRPR